MLWLIFSRNLCTLSRLYHLPIIIASIFLPGSFRGFIAMDFSYINIASCSCIKIEFRNLIIDYR